MTSILTNVAAMSALQTLRSINSNMEDTQNRVSSGLRVGSASDNAAYWSIATTMRSDNLALSSVQDALGLGAAKVDTAYAGMNSSIEVVKQIKAKLVAATEDGIDKTKIQEEIKQLQEQLTSISDASAFSGENWLKADLSGTALDLTKSVVASFVRDGSAVSVKKVNVLLSADNVLFDSQTTAASRTGILDKTTSLAGLDGTATAANVSVSNFVITNDVTTASLDTLIQYVDTALGKMTSAAANLGSLSMRIDLQEDFVSKLTESIDKGVGRLVDADMNEESTRLKALQTQQQLAIQSLSIANTSAQNVLSLFR